MVPEKAHPSAKGAEGWGTLDHSEVEKRRGTPALNDKVAGCQSRGNENF
jgi:hypothetical protein